MTLISYSNDDVLVMYLGFFTKIQRCLLYYERFIYVVLFVFYYRVRCVSNGNFIRSTGSNDSITRLISVPSFVDTSSCVLVNLSTLDCQQICLNSDGC